MHLFTGPWWIVKSLPGALYKIECAHKPSRQDKKHAADLLPYPPELIPFEPIDTTNNCYSQLYPLIDKSPYKEASIKGFTPPQPFPIASHFLTKADFRDFHFPTLVELNDDICPFPWINNKEQMHMMLRDDFDEAPILYHGPLPSLTILMPPSTPILSLLIAAIIALSDQLFLYFTFPARQSNHP
jgi:hypothetical protein